MERLGVPAIFLNSDMKAGKEFYRDLGSGSSPYKLIYCTPEKLVNSDVFVDILMNLDKQGKIDRFVIDEAHCVCSWG